MWASFFWVYSNIDIRRNKMITEPKIPETNNVIEWIVWYFKWLTYVILMMTVLLALCFLTVIVPGFVLGTLIGLPLRWLMYG